jgi:hypothetical protein
MSFRLTAAAIAADVATAPQKMVLVVLADIADDAGKCWPSLGFIAKRAAMSRKSVIDQIPKLEAAGHLSVSREGKCNTYVVHPLQSVTHGDQSLTVTSHPRLPVTNGDQSLTVTRPVTHGDHHQSPTVTPLVTHGDPNQSLNQSLNQSVNQPHAPPMATPEGNDWLDDFEIPEPEPKAAPIPPPTPAPAPAPTPKPKPSPTKPEPDPEAVAQKLPGNPSPALAAAWEEWQQYRQEKARAKLAKDRRPWTAQAARLSANQIVEHAARLGERIVLDRITSAIAGNWQGLNLHDIESPRKSHSTAKSYEEQAAEHRPDKTSKWGF